MTDWNSRWKITNGIVSCQYLDRAIREYQCALPELSLQHRHRAERSIAIAQEIIYEVRGSEA
jgi:hypothetical protein